MAFKAGGEVGHPGKGLGFEGAVTGVTPQSLIHMLFVIERDGLLALRAKTEADGQEKR